jgi:acetyl-CoA C-acetyltransferase
MDPGFPSVTRSGRPAAESWPPWVREMTRRNARYGLETMCIGGGQGLAAVYERV